MVICHCLEGASRWFVVIHSVADARDVLHKFYGRRVELLSYLLTRPIADPAELADGDAVYAGGGKLYARATRRVTRIDGASPDKLWACLQSALDDAGSPSSSASTALLSCALGSTAGSGSFGVHVLGAYPSYPGAEAGGDFKRACADVATICAPPPPPPPLAAAHNERSIQVILCGVNGRSRIILADPSWLVDRLHEEAAGGAPNQDLRLTSNGRMLKKGSTLASNGINADYHTVHIMFTLRGGMHHASSLRLGCSGSSASDAPGMCHTRESVRGVKVMVCSVDIDAVVQHVRPRSAFFGFEAVETGDSTSLPAHLMWLAEAVSRHVVLQSVPPPVRHTCVLRRDCDLPQLQQQVAADGSSARQPAAADGSAQQVAADGGSARQPAAADGSARQPAAADGSARQVAVADGSVRQVAAGGGSVRQVAADGGSVRQVAADGGLERQAAADGGLDRKGTIAWRVARRVVGEWPVCDRRSLAKVCPFLETLYLRQPGQSDESLFDTFLHTPLHAKREGGGTATAPNCDSHG